MNRSESVHRVKLRPSVPIISLQQSKLQKNSAAKQNISTQTIFEDECKNHNKKITELLTEVAISHSNISKCQTEIANLKDEVYDTREKLNEERNLFDRKLQELKTRNYEKELEVTKFKMINLQEKNELLTHINQLRAELQNALKHSENISQDSISERIKMQNQLIANTMQLKQEIEKNSELKQKITKFKNRYKLLTNYTKHLIQTPQIETQMNTYAPSEPKQQTVETNVENIVLSELFYKRNRPEDEKLNSIFYNQNSKTDKNIN